MKKIIKARITEGPKSIFDFDGKLPEVWVVFTGEKSEKMLFSYYPDEISFRPEEFIGKTEQEARTLFFEKDKKYLQS